MGKREGIPSCQGNGGVGNVLAPKLIAEIGDVRRFHNGKALIAHAGIDAPPYQSGQFTGTERKISKRGSSSLRKIGYEVMRCLKTHKEPEDAAVYRFILKKEKEGKSKCAAKIAGLNKFLGQIHQRKREFARYFAVGLTPKGAAKILAWEAAIVALRPILLTIVINIPLMAWMLDAGGITAGDFIAKRLPLVPAILLFVAVIGFVALAYYLGGKKICDMNLVEAIKDDTLML